MSKDLFTVAGVARNPDGEMKVRFANDIVTRTKILVKAGCTEIELVELPEPMSKLNALRVLAEKNYSGDAGFVVQLKLAEKTKQAKKAQLKISGVALSAAEEKEPTLAAE